MIRYKLNWELFSNQERHYTIQGIKKSITDSHGSILNFEMYSDVSLSINIEINECDIINLHTELALIGHLSGIDETSINKQSPREWIIFLNVTFVKGEGKLRSEVPEVPG